MQQEHTNLDKAAPDLITEARNHEKTCTKVQIIGGRGWRDHWVEFVEVSDHWPPGSSSQPDDFVQIRLKKPAGACMEVSVGGAEPIPVDLLALRFRGTAEIHSVIASLELLVRKLKAISELRDP